MDPTVRRIGRQIDVELNDLNARIETQYSRPVRIKNGCTTPAIALQPNPYHAIVPTLHAVLVLAALLWARPPPGRRAAALFGAWRREHGKIRSIDAR